MNDCPHPNPLPKGEGTINEKQTRREMCRSLLRYLALSGAGLTWAVLYVRSARSSNTDCCPQSLSCGGCALLERCDLHPAAKSRDINKKQ
jgi:hypothetical protein